MRKARELLVEAGNSPINFQPLRAKVGNRSPHPRCQALSILFVQQGEEILFELALALGANIPTLQ